MSPDRSRQGELPGLSELPRTPKGCWGIEKPSSRISSRKPTDAAWMQRHKTPHAAPSPLSDAIERAVTRPTPAMTTVLRAMPVHDPKELRDWLLDPATEMDLKDVALRTAITAAVHESEAAVLVVYCLLPGLARLATRFSTFDREEVWSELVTALLERVRRYDPERRHRRVAANLLLDTLSTVCGWSRREVRAHGPSALDHQETPDPQSRVCPLDEGLRRGVVRPAGAALISATRLGGMPLDAAAALLGLRYEAAKKRRRRAEVALVRWWSEPEPAHGWRVASVA